LGCVLEVGGIGIEDCGRGIDREREGWPKGAGGWLLQMAGHCFSFFRLFFSPLFFWVIAH